MRQVPGALRIITATMRQCTNLIAHNTHRDFRIARTHAEMPKFQATRALAGEALSLAFWKTTRFLCAGVFCRVFGVAQLVDTPSSAIRIARMVELSWVESVLAIYSRLAVSLQQRIRIAA